MNRVLIRNAEVVGSVLSLTPVMSVVGKTPVKKRANGCGAGIYPCSWKDAGEEQMVGNID